MNYFEIMGLPVAFRVDEAALRKKFYQNSRDFHPDFFSLADDEKQAWAMDQSTLNNTAYATLSDFDKRLAYVLQLKGLIGDPARPDTLPQDFLMEMMDINEAIMDLQMDFDAGRYDKTLKEVKSIENQLFDSVKLAFEQYEDDGHHEGDLEKIKNFYLKKKYLLRIRESLSNFAPA